MERPPALSAADAKAKILLILQDGRVEPTYHCRRDSMANRSVGLDDIFSALETGTIRRQPEWDAEYENWKYRVEGYDVENDDLTAVTVIIEADWMLKIITVF